MHIWSLCLKDNLMLVSNLSLSASKEILRRGYSLSIEAFVLKTIWCYLSLSASKEILRRGYSLFIEAFVLKTIWC